MSTSLRSGLYQGTVRHRRFTPQKNAFRYGVYQLLLDLSELSALDRTIGFFGYNRARPVSFHDRDHMGETDEPVRAKLARWLSAQGRELGDSRVLLLTNPRVLGYVFNPVSYFFCLDSAGALRFTVAEVFNTFGEMFCYLLDGTETHQWARSSLPRGKALSRLTVHADRGRQVRVGRNAPGRPSHDSHRRIRS